MEQFWRNTGIQLGKQWKIVFAVVAVITGLLTFGASKIEFATGQDSYLNPDSQVAIDNVAFQDDFGGETIILLFSADDDTQIPALFDAENLAELRRVTDEISAVPEVYSTVTPSVSLTYSSELVGGATGTQALTGALSRDDAGAEARGADISISLARRAAAGPQETWTLDNPDWVELLLFANSGYTVGEDGAPIAPELDDRIVRSSLQGTFPSPDPGRIHQTAVGGIILDGNASLDELSIGTDQVVEILEGAEFDGFELTITGSPIYLGEINDYLKGGTLTLGLAALAVMAIVLGLIFSVRWRLLPLLAVVIGVFWAFSILGLLGIDLSLVTIAGLPILIGLGIDFAIQIHNRVEEEVVLDQEAHPISETLANVAPPLTAATVTGVLAFLALRISKVPMIRDFGVLLAIGVVVLVAIGIIVPVAALGIREWSDRTDERKESAVEKLVVRLGGLPTKVAPALIVLAAVMAVGGVAVEGSTKIQSDPIEWIDQSSQTVADIDRLADETEFASTLGVLVTSNNVFDQQVVDLIYDFTQDAEARPEVIATSSLVGTVEKIIDIEGATALSPTSADIESADAAARDVTPDIARVLVNDDRTAAQINLRLAQGSLEDRSVLVDELDADLDARIAALDVPAESILLVDLPDGQDPVKATPAGLATVGIGLLENLSANRANLTYLALALAGLFLVIRLRSLPRALLALVPVMMAVGASSLFVGLLGFELSPLTTVSGPLVVATCAEFSVLILGRYLEERQNGLTPRAATDTAAGRTGRAFFTSALTTIGGFAVLIVSPLPLLRDFGIIVTLNVAIALLAALVAMPPLSVWVDEKGWLGTQEQGTTGDTAVRMAAVATGRQAIGAAVGAVALLAGVFAVYVSADTSNGAVDDVAYAAQPLPADTDTTTATTAPGAEPLPDDEQDEPADSAPTDTAPTDSAPSDSAPSDSASSDSVPADSAPSDSVVPDTVADSVPTETAPAEPDPEPTPEPEGPEIDPSGFSADRPTDPIQATVFDLLVGGGAFTGQGVDPMAANCGIETTIADNGATVLTLLAAGDATAVDQVKTSVARCGIAPEIVDAALAEFQGG